VFAAMGWPHPPKADSGLRLVSVESFQKTILLERVSRHVAEEARAEQVFFVGCPD
jgi:hypothetical protein